LTGDVEVGIWGVGCNVTEKKNGFGIVQSLSEEPNPPASPLSLPGQRMTASGLHENWNRVYDPALGRYLSADPLIQTAAFPQLSWASPYEYALNRPVNRADSDGQFSVDYASLKGCHAQREWDVGEVKKGYLKHWAEVKKQLKVMAADCECRAAFKRLYKADIEELLAAGEGPRISWGTTQRNGVPAEYGTWTNEVTYSCGDWNLQNISPAAVQATVILHELGHYANDAAKTFGSKIPEPQNEKEQVDKKHPHGGANEVEEICRKALIRSGTLSQPP